MNFFKSLVVLLLIVACCVQFNEAKLTKWFNFKSKRTNNVKYYDEINAFLSKNLPSDESAESNLRLLEQWQAQLKSKQANLKQAIGQFLELKNLLPDDQLCSPSSGEILEAIDEATGGSLAELHGTDGPEDARLVRLRTQRILYKIAERHFRECPSKLVGQFQAHYDGLARESRDRVEAIEDQMKFLYVVTVESFPERLAAIKKFTFEENKLNDEYLATYTRLVHDMKIVIDLIKEQTDKPNADWAELFQRKLIGPCTEYVDGLRPVLSPLRFDYSHIEPDFNNQDDVLLLRSMMSYQACEKLIKHKELLFRDLPEYAEFTVTKSQEEAAVYEAESVY